MVSVLTSGVGFSAQAFPVHPGVRQWERQIKFDFLSSEIPVIATTIFSVSSFDRQSASQRARAFKSQRARKLLIQFLVGKF
jgi:hypothetical protein